MKNVIPRFIELTSYFFILLFCYATISKVIDFKNFQIQIAQSPLLSAYAYIITYGVLAVEMAVCFLLIFKQTRIFGLFGSYLLMVLFTIYIYLILNYSDFIPCSCGGILEKMNWQTHFIFNLICILFSVAALLLSGHQNKLRLWKMVIGLLVIIIVSSIAMWSLYRKSENIMSRDNGFQRRFLQHPILKDKVFNLKLNSYYFAGFNKDTLYLGNYTAPFTVTKIINMSEMQSYNISLSRTDLEFRLPTMEVKDSISYFYDGMIPIVFKGKTGTKSFEELNVGKTYFRKIRNIDGSTFIIGAFHRKMQIQTLGKISTGAKDSIVLKPNLLDKTNDGFFEPDGDLNLDRYTGKVVYVYHYKNQFVVTDRSLSSKHVYKTIDTVSIPKLGISYLSNGDKKLNNPLMVNKKSFAYKGVLFIESDRNGKLEKDRGRKAIILDLYSISEQKYLGSIIVPNRNEEKRTQFYIHNNFLYLIIQNELIRYRFAQNITKHFIAGEAENQTKE